MNENDLNLLLILKKVGELSQKYDLKLTYDYRQLSDQIARFNFRKDENNYYLKILEVTSGNDRVWIEVTGAPPIRFILKDAVKALKHLENLF